MKTKVLIGLIFVMFLVACENEAIVTDEYNKVTVINTDTDEVLYETTIQDEVKQIVNKINKSKRTDKWDTLGTSLELILSNETNTVKASYYADGNSEGDIVINDYYIKSRFKFLE